MRFYYPSLVSSLLWVIYCVIAIAVVWLVLRSVRGRKLGWPLALGSAFVVAMLPWLEEWWIAFRFAQLCRKDAGVFVNKVVEVDGFYDDTSGWGVRQLLESKYRFMESNDILSRRLLRVEPADDASRRRALAWHAENNPGKDAATAEFIVFKASVDEQIVVSGNGVNAWRVAKIDEPTARYHYKKVSNGTPVAHQITRGEDVVLDSQTGEVVGRLTDYGRGAYWFFVGLDRPTRSCEETRDGIRKHGSLIYRAVLKPSKGQ